VTDAVHRLIERRASITPDVVAILDGDRMTTYGELNQMGNALARRLRESGLSRGSLAIVRMPRSTELAAMLLAVLKAGACYAWTEPGSSEDVSLPASVCICRESSGEEEQFLALDIDRALSGPASQPGPNLPVLTRGTDVACVLPDINGHPNVLVPHATISALPRTRPLRQAWEGCAGALDLWMGLMSGTTMTVGVSSHATAAA
jgi:non-ribosomal peptide synthetase component F